MDIREEFEKWYQDHPWHHTNIEASKEAMLDAWEAALSANGGEVEPVAWAVFADNGNIRIWGREKPEAFPEAVPLYLGPTVKDFLTVQSEPIGYADPDTFSDYREGARLHIPVYRPDASAEWQNGVPVYLGPALPVESRSETDALYEFARELDDMLECMTREEAKMGLRLAIQEAAAKADRLRAANTKEQ